MSESIGTFELQWETIVALTGQTDLVLGSAAGQLDIPRFITGTADIVTTASASSLGAIIRPPLAGARVSFAGHGEISLSLRQRHAEYRLVVVNRTGWPLAELDKANLTGCSWELDEPGTIEFEMDTADPKAREVKPGREVQVWLGPQILHWGPIVRPLATPVSLSVQAHGLMWYFTKRFLGTADRTNLVVNGDFEQGLTGWAGSNDPHATIVNATEGIPMLSNGRAVRLQGDAVGHQQYLYQKWVAAPGGHPLGNLITISCWVYVPQASYDSMATEARGMWVASRDATEVLPGTSAKRVNQHYMTRIDGTEPLRNRWVPFQVELFNVMPGDEIEVRLYPPKGIAYYDLVVAAAMESLAFDDDPLIPSGGIDQAKIIEGLVLYAQDLFPGFRHGKSDLNISTNCQLTGFRYERAFQFADHLNIKEAWAEFTQGDNSVDVSVEITPTTRIFTTHFPFKGQYRPELALEYGRNIADFSFGTDLEQAASDVVILGPGDGPTRPEGGARNPDGFDGLTLEKVQSIDVSAGLSEDYARVNIVDDVARETLRVSSSPAFLEVSTYEQGGQTLLGRLNTGDYLPVRILCGSIDVTVPSAEEPNLYYRITAMTLEPENDVLRLTMNLFDPTVFAPEAPITLEEAMARFPRAVDACRRPGGGVWVVGSDGGVGSYGGAPFYGSMGGLALHAPMVAILPHGGDGYWLIGADNGVFAFGSAPFLPPYEPMFEEWARGDRAIVNVELDGPNSFTMIADDGSTYSLSA